MFCGSREYECEEYECLFHHKTPNQNTQTGLSVGWPFYVTMHEQNSTLRQTGPAKWLALAPIDRETNKRVKCAPATVYDIS